MQLQPSLGSRNYGIVKLAWLLCGGLYIYLRAKPNQARPKTCQLYHLVHTGQKRIATPLVLVYTPIACHRMCS